MQLNYWGRPSPLLAFWDPRYAPLHFQSLHAQGTAIAAPKFFPRPIPPGKEIIPAQTPPHCGTQQGRRKVSDPQDPGTGPPKLKRPPCPIWMSPDSIRLIDKRAALLRTLAIAATWIWGSSEPSDGPLWRTLRDEWRMQQLGSQRFWTLPR